MFRKTAQYYDEIYGSMEKDYDAEANKIVKYIQKHKRTQGNTLLDVACGTGMHAGLLNKHYKVEGLDYDPNMLKVARRKNPGIRFHKGNMVNFDLGRQFDAVTCLFSSIGYAKSKSNLRKAIQTMSRHLLSGGVLLVEPWFSPKQWNRGQIHTFQMSKPDLKIVRMSYSGQRGKVCILNFQYLIGTPKGIQYMAEVHEVGLFTHEEYMEAFSLAGLSVRYVKKGLTGRGLYIGRKASK